MFFKLVHIVLLASVKYVFTLPYAMLIGVDYKYAILAVLLGGIGGFLLFFYLSKPLARGLSRLWPLVCNAVPAWIKNQYSCYCERKAKMKKKVVFSKRKRFLVRINKEYGFWGIIVATPVLLSIPIGAFLASKYYAHKKNIVWYMILSIIGWAGVFSGIIFLFPNVFL